MPVLIVKQAKQRAGWRLTESIDIGRLPQNALALDAHGVSREHARITVAGETCTIEDLGSTNGTWVNGKKVEQPQMLVAGDEIVIGKIRLTFLEQDALPIGLTQLKPRKRQKQIVFRCGSCNAVLQSPLKLAGQKGKCAGCGTRFIVPLASGVVADPITKTKPQSASRASVGPGDLDAYDLASGDSATDDSSIDFDAVNEPVASASVAPTQPDDRPADTADVAISQDSIDFADNDRISSSPDDVVPFAATATSPDDHVDDDAADIAAADLYASSETVMGFDFDAMVDVDDPPTETQPCGTAEPATGADATLEPFDREPTATEPTTPAPAVDQPTNDWPATDAQMMLASYRDVSDDPFVPASRPDDEDVTPGTTDVSLEMTDDAPFFTHDAVDVVAQHGNDQQQGDESDSVPVPADPEYRADDGDLNKQLGRDESRAGELQRDVVDGTDAVEHVADAPPAIDNVDVLPIGQHDMRDDDLVAAPLARTSDGAEYLAEAPAERSHRESGAESQNDHTHESDWWQDAVVVLEREDETPGHDPIMATLNRSASRRGSNVGLVARVQRHAAQRARQIEHVSGAAATARFMGMVSDKPAVVEPPAKKSPADKPPAGGVDAAPAAKAAPAQGSTAQTITLSPDELGVTEAPVATDAPKQWRRKSNDTTNHATDARRGEMVDNSHLIDWLEQAPAPTGAATAVAEPDELIDWMPDDDQAAPPTEQDPGAPTDQVCSICGSDVCEYEETVICPDCSTVYHESCWQENLGCATYGCKQVGAMDAKQQRVRQQPNTPRRKALPRRKQQTRRKLNDGTPWEVVLLAAAFVAMVFGLVAFGAPSAVALIVTALYKKRHRKRRFTGAMFATIVSLNVLGLVAGAAASWYLFIR